MPSNDTLEQLVGALLIVNAAATTLDGLKSALLGLSSTGKVAGRPA